MTTIIIGVLIGIAIWSGLFAVICLIDKLDEDIAQILLCGVWSIPFLLFEGLYKPIMKIRVYFFNKKYRRIVLWWYKDGKKVNGQQFWVHKNLLTDVKEDKFLEIHPAGRTKTIPDKDSILTKKEFEASYKK